MTAITTAIRLLHEAATELKSSHTRAGDWGDEHETLDAYNEYIATASALERLDTPCLHQISEPAAVAGELLSLHLDLVAATPAVPAEGFELWWADHMPNATQAEAWAAWVAVHQDTPAGVQAEPVAWLHTHKATGQRELSFRKLDENEFNQTRWDSAPLYTAPQATQPPCAWAISYDDGKTPYTLWHEGDGALLDTEIKRLGGSACKMPIYTIQPQAPAAPDERDAEIAGLSASVGHLSALVDSQHTLLKKAKAAMTALHGAALPIDESGGDLDARIPASAFARFVDEHAALLHAMAQSPVAAPAAPVVKQCGTEPVFLEVRAGVRYWEDAKVNGVEDERGDLIPLRSGDDWVPTISLADGLIEGWPQGTSADIHYKVCDDGEYFLLNADRQRVRGYEGYVPDMLAVGDNGYGDYIILKVGPTGHIEGWSAPSIDTEEWPLLATTQAAPAAPAVDALDATDRECLAIGRAINRAAGELPADGEIRIDIENGAGTVYVLEPKHGDWRYIDSGDVFSAQINAAIDAAIAAQAAAQGGEA